MGVLDRCPLTGKSGTVLRIRKPSELAASYATYFGAPLPDAIVAKYFNTDITEYYSAASGLRWYAPADLGDGDYYSTLGGLYPWYYRPASWDKFEALDQLKGRGRDSVVEMGSGSGWLLDRLRENGVSATGVEINPDAVQDCRKRGLDVLFPEELDGRIAGCDWLCLLQTIEHVEKPVEFLEKAIRQLNPRFLVMSAPCFESLLGYTTDPLSWPPHHATAWSERAFRTLGQILNYRVTRVSYSPIGFSGFRQCLLREKEGRMAGIPEITEGWTGRLRFLAARLRGRDWARRGHSIFVVLER
ncbi:MAG TPA: methyltransferase domain-containing protein [Acidobacteriaceae bacterium]|jgi:SAM-dependent methyltransferase|nr:methyltransferase domain-containing protein [Acidobacteriaceae bacterium]